jgi:GNAT superfamily N-acetyltransferase
MNSSLRVRPMTVDDKYEVADLIYASINTWYRLRGMPQIFRGGPKVTEVFFDVYNALDAGSAVVAENTDTGRLMGSCFYHPRKHHVALGIMNVHPNYFGQGVGSKLLSHIMDFTDRNGYKALRLTQSALNLDSFSLYNRAGFVPRCAYQDMWIEVPADGLKNKPPGSSHVRDAKLADVPAIAALEMDVSGVTREQDYRYCIENTAGFWHTSVYENATGGIDGFLASSLHPALNMLGPGITRTDEQALALIQRELDINRGRSPVLLVPVERVKIVRQMYDWGARNCELHFCQVRGEFKPFNGANFPTFILETA